MTVPLNNEEPKELTQTERVNLALKEIQPILAKYNVELSVSQVVNIVAKNNKSEKKQ